MNVDVVASNSTSPSGPDRYLPTLQHCIVAFSYDDVMALFARQDLAAVAEEDRAVACAG